MGQTSVRTGYDIYRPTRRLVHPREAPPIEALDHYLSGLQQESKHSVFAMQVESVVPTGHRYLAVSLVAAPNAMK